uniref:Telomerase reverse transcriptase n=1 Tax=Romanomermis culicivorax TaxID=13658 RepID=A0A915K162_ROMCU
MIIIMNWRLQRNRRVKWGEFDQSVAFDNYLKSAESRILTPTSAIMDILKLHYVYCQPVISIFDHNHKLPKKMAEFENFYRFLRSTFLCSSKAINEWVTPGYSNNIDQCSKVDNVPCTLFVKELRRFNHALVELYSEADLIFDFKKLNTSNFRHLYKILGDRLFERLLQDFDIFIRLDQNRYAQIVGSDLSKKASTLIREISNRNYIYCPMNFTKCCDLDLKSLSAMYCENGHEFKSPPRIKLGYCLRNSKPLWSIIRRKMATKMKNCFMRSKNNRDMFGPFAYKYIPKVSGFRPILLNYMINDRKIEKMNNVLKPYLAILHDCFSKNPHLIGQQQSYFTMIKTIWRSFKENYSYNYGDMLSRKLYFVKADLESCFDSLLHKKLLIILENNLKPALSPIYAVQKFCILAKKNGELFRRYLFTAWPLDRGIGDPKKEILNFMKRRHLSDHSSKRSNRNNCIIVTNREQSLPVIHRDELIQILRRFICENVVKLCRRFYLRKRGVAQGSTISVALCNLYMADFERRKLKEFIVEPNRDLLMRHVDDYLYVTPDKDRAVKFARSMLAGCPDYGLKSSIGKMSINFDRENFFNDFVDGAKIAVFRHASWCGLNFDSFTAEISSDDERWLRSDDFRDFITINYCKNADRFVLSRLNHYLAARNHEICFDDRINSPLVIRRNIRRAFIFLARCYQSFSISFTNKRLKISCDVVAASLAKKMYILLTKSSSKKKSSFTVKFCKPSSNEHIEFFWQFASEILAWYRFVKQPFYVISCGPCVKDKDSEIIAWFGFPCVPSVSNEIRDHRKPDYYEKHF